MKPLSLGIAAVLAYGICGPAVSAEKEKKAGIEAGPGMFYPSISIDLSHDNNIWYQPSDAKSSWITVVSPVLEFKKEYQGQQYRLNYQADIGRYHSSSDDNYVDQRLLGEGDFGFGQRGRFNLQAEYIDAHDFRGTGRTSGVTTLPEKADEWHSSRLEGKFTYGAKKNDKVKGGGGMELNARSQSITYDTNREFTEFYDRKDAEGGVQLYYNVLPRTSVLVEARRTAFDYRTATLDSNEDAIFVGASWEAAAKTTGTVKVGRVKKDMDSPARQDFSGMGWDVSVEWRPLSYSTVALTTYRKPRETDLSGDLIISRGAGAVWTHGWTSFLNTKLNFQSYNNEYKGSTLNYDMTEYGAGVTYRMRRWLELGAGYTSRKRDANDDAIDYKQNILMFTGEVTL